MDALTMMLVLSCPLLEDDSLQQFPTLSAVRTQQEHCLEHLDRLEAAELFYGWEDGRWAMWRDEIRESMGYWQLLEECHAESSHPRKQAAMRRLKEYLGVKNFDKGWHPPEIPPRWDFKIRDCP